MAELLVVQNLIGQPTSNKKIFQRTFFSQGVEIKGNKKKLSHVVSVEPSQDGFSHLNSITDIVVGAFRFVINEPDKDQVGSILLKSLAELMWGKADKDGVIQVLERGLCIRPKVIKNPEYAADIDSFINRLRAYQQS